MKIALVIIGIVIIAGVAWYLLSGNTDDTKTNTATTNTTTNTPINRNANTNAGTSLGVPAPGSNVNEMVVNTGQGVSITSSGFSPRTVTINAGESVTWTNEDSRTHYVVPDTHPTHTKYAGVWDDDGAGSISTGESYVQTFDQAGTYTYHDHLNSSVTGTVVVQ